MRKGPNLKNKIKNRGFTLSELMVGVAALAIVMLGTSVALVDGNRGWNQTYNRVNSDVVTGSHIAQRKFDTIVRKSSSQWFNLDPDKNWVEVYYYADANSVLVDRYARFYESNGNLCVEYGKRSPREALNVETICGNVTYCRFQNTGRSVQMALELDNGREKLTTITSAILHN
jgi:prepilin-type N-terminal cleavage/methylation domain-containing protein